MSVSNSYMVWRLVSTAALAIVLIIALSSDVGTAGVTEPNQGRVVSVPSAEPDWNKLDAEALNYYRRYLQFDTSNPPGDVTAAIAFIEKILDNEGIHTETYSSSPGKVSLVASLAGPAGEKPFLMMSHVDVVPAVASKWSHPPFAAELADGYVWARGAIDDKGHGIMALMTMLALKRQQVPLRRGVEMMVNADEEVGGELGAGWMVENHWDVIDPAFAINEGGGGIVNWMGYAGPSFRIATAEKRVMWLKLTAHGRSGHGSEPNPENPNLIMINALARLMAKDPPLRLTPIFDQAMKTAAARMSLPESLELSHLELPLMLQAAARGPLADYTMQALMRDTISPTVLTSGVKVNVIPSTAEAQLDCRLLPGSDSEAFLKRMRDLMADSRISIEFIQKPDEAPASPAEGDAWGAIRDTVQRDFKDAIVVPWMTAGGTDSRFLRQKGVPAYGFDPIVTDRLELTRVHGVDERLSVENLNRGIRAMYDLAVELCGPHPS